MFFDKAPTGASTKPTVFRGPSVRVEISFRLLLNARSLLAHSLGLSSARSSVDALSSLAPCPPLDWLAEQSAQGGRAGRGGSFFSALLVRRNTDPSHDEPEWLSELSDLVDSLPDLVATFDRDGRLLMINKAGIALLGCTQQTLAGLLISDLYPEPDAERILGDALQDALTHGSWTGCAELQDADGQRVDTHQRWVAHHPDQGQPHQGRTGAFTLMARRLSESCTEAEVRNRRESLAAMSLGFVHDLNNVLGPITMYAELAAMTIETDSPARRYIEQITRAAERGRALSSRLAALARAREPKRSVVDMAEIVREIVGWLRVARPDLHIELSCDDVATTVVGDPVQLHQVVMNLAQNSVQALSDRTGSVRIRIDHASPPQWAQWAQWPQSAPSAVPNSSYLRLGVRDDGRGIDEATKARIFEPFFSTRTDGSGLGLGLGLSVSREIVRAHDGVITVERSEPKGTTATVYLPLWTEDTAD